MGDHMKLYSVGVRGGLKKINKANFLEDENPDDSKTNPKKIPIKMAIMLFHSSGIIPLGIKGPIYFYFLLIKSNFF